MRSVQMKVSISGHSDDIILVQGDLYKEFKLKDIGEGKVVILCPIDNTYLEFHFYTDEEGFWKVGQLSKESDYIKATIFTDDCGDRFVEVESLATDFDVLVKN